MINIIKEKWKVLNEREQTILVWGCLGLILIGYYSLILSPLMKEKALLVNRLQVEKKFYEKTQQQVQKIVHLGFEQEPNSSLNMKEFIQDSSKKYELSPNNINRLSKNKWTLSFESVNLVNFIDWLEQLQKAGIVIEKFSISKNETKSIITVEDLEITSKIH